ncbi:DUF624 domain-containing protein [Changpingibacter yushuensis]|uniref:DUF624 domain-containing protein n=1 Tax=Changpingibacter yushuensis TaxID=2758440 RepID=UPI0015F74AC5|nr:DUF624 domain-containing protein [Changpingibacter yushuensis]
MAGLLAPDSSFYKALSAATDLVLVNLATLAGCIPIVTAGASLTACARVTMEMAREEDSYIMRTWWRSFRSNLIQSFGWWIPTLVIVILAWLENWLLGGISSPSTAGALTGVLVIGLVVLLAILVWLLPLQAFFTNSVGGHVGNAAMLAIGKLVQTILCLLVLALPVVLFAFLPGSRVAVAWFMVIIGFAFISYMAALIQAKTINALRDAA